MRVVVFEPDHAGHHFDYVRVIVPALLDLGAEVTLATTRAAVESAQYKLFMGPLTGRIRVDDSTPSGPGWDYRASAARARNMIECVARVKADHLIVPYADGLSQALTVRGLRGGGTIPKGVTSEALFMRGGFAYPAASLKRRLFVRASWELARRSPYTWFHHLDPLAYYWILAHRPREAHRWSLMPDPVERPSPATAIEARRRLQLPEDGRIIGCAGSIDGRKGCDLLVRAFLRASTEPTDRLVLIGIHTPEVTRVLEGEAAAMVRSGRIVSQDRFLNPEDFALSLRAMDVVCTPYPGHVGSASIVIRAAAADRPVLGSDFGWVARTVELFGLGWTCHVENIDELAGAIRRSLDQAHEYRHNEAARRFVRFHSPENFASSWTVHLRERMGLGAGKMLRTWEWVTEVIGKTGL